MRSFAQIVSDAGPDEKIAGELGVKRHAPRDWRLRDRIPSEYWADFSRNGWATLDELAGVAATKRPVAA